MRDWNCCPCKTIWNPLYSNINKVTFNLNEGLKLLPLQDNLKPSYSNIGGQKCWMWKLNKELASANVWCPCKAYTNTLKEQVRIGDCCPCKQHLILDPCCPHWIKVKVKGKCSLYVAMYDLVVKAGNMNVVKKCCRFPTTHNPNLCITEALFGCMGLSTNSKTVSLIPWRV